MKIKRGCNYTKMRPIKFRAFVNGKMEYDPSISCSGSEDYEVNDAFLEGGNADKIWMQFTGLLDKNGKEIYEGDIVKFSKEPKYKRTWEVRWIDGVGFSLVDGIGYRILESDNFPKCSEYGEVIGNVWEGLHSGEKFEWK